MLCWFRRGCGGLHVVQYVNYPPNLYGYNGRAVKHASPRRQMLWLGVPKKQKGQDTEEFWTRFYPTILFGDGLKQPRPVPFAAPAPVQHPVSPDTPAVPQAPSPLGQDADSGKAQLPQPVKVPSPVLLALPNSRFAAFGLEFLSANGVETGSVLPVDLQCIYLKANPNSCADANGKTTFAIGRIHQQKVFEAWVPDQTLQCCISRTAFEVVCDAQGGSASLIVRGQGLVSVDGKVAPREAPVPLHPRSEICFAHAVEGTLILRLRYVPASELSHVEKEEASSPPPRRVRRMDAEDDDVRSPSARPRSSWVLVCVHVEGLSPGRLAELRSAARDIQVSQMPMNLGRLHQNQFEALVKAAEKPKLASFISRTHGKLEADPDGTGLLLTNVSPSNNPNLSCTID